MKFSFLLLFILYTVRSIGQANDLAGILETGKEGYLTVTDSVIKQELGLLTLKSTGIAGGNRAADTKILKEIPLYYCADTVVHFTDNNFFSSYLGVGVYVSGDRPGLKLTNIVVGYNHQFVYVPETALIDMVNPAFCQPQGGKKERFATQACDVHQSKDRRRIYIHMVNEEEKNRFEVTWIIKDRKYYGRVIDRL